MVSAYTFLQNFRISEIRNTTGRSDLCGGRADRTGYRRAVHRRGAQGSCLQSAPNGEDEELSRADQRGKMVMMRERACVVREPAIRVALGVERLYDAAGSERSFAIPVERRDQVKADIPDKYEHQHDGAPPPDERHASCQGPPFPLCPQTYTPALSYEKAITIDAEVRSWKSEVRRKPKEAKEAEDAEETEEVIIYVICLICFLCLLCFSSDF